MTTHNNNNAIASFYDEITNSATGCNGWAAFQKLVDQTVGAKLLTFMDVDMENGVARRSYSSDEQSYPVTGEKPITRDDWFDVVHIQNRAFVANTIDGLADVFPDHGLIASLGCGSVVNLPVRVAGELVGTVNLLHAEQHYDEQKVRYITSHFHQPAQLAYLLARSFG
ncbi:GAF domain-containing protein [Maritalea porphyrae]|jgi:hypothetical protein|uniref:GAF domain-containing protein n=1 Tax=Maritalea porphyrae TaxID=880732 RepID=UPI0022AEF3DE|nr:GAF domain-containing protein [Maritalea porphyrae]MCZ4272041.1 GAF domain-containing protein [Maritalea porphyrae]